MPKPQPTIPLNVVARLLYIALSYGSREQRIRAMLNSSDVQVSLLASTLKYSGFLTMTGVTVKPDRHTDLSVSP